MNKITVGGWERISKAKAKKLFENGEQFKVVPCNVSPINSWGLGMEIQKGDLSVGHGFQNFLNSYEFFNCRYELGRYCAFYVKSE